MSPKKNLAHGVTCAEGISLLYLLHSVPARPSRKHLTDHDGLAQGYILSLSDENRLVEAFAFLSNIDHDVNRIPAVCIQQVPEASSLNVLLAVNQLKWGEGSQFLQQLREGFEPIFALLAKPKQRLERHEAQEEILAAIISMCSRRILIRLRLVAGRESKPKPPIQDILRTAISGLKQAGRPVLGIHVALSITFIGKAKEAIRYADAWAKHRILPRLQDLVNAIHSLRYTGDIEAMLRTLPNRIMDPSMRKNVYNIINKVARYRDISRHLLRMSNKQELVRRMNLVTVELPPIAWSRTEENASNRTLDSVFSELNAPSQKQGLVQVLRTLHITEVDANRSFMAQTRKTLAEAKIHAEVQLVYYCELNPSKLPSRIIASSKDACFLCNAFISMHGKMHTSRTHGRLYPGWRLPIVPDLVQLEQRFNEVLAAQIRVSIATMVSTGRKTVYPDPNESTLLSLVHSESTMPSAVGEPADGRNAVVERLDVSSSPSDPTSPSSREQDELSNTPEDEAGDCSNSLNIHIDEPVLSIPLQKYTPESSGNSSIQGSCTTNPPVLSSTLSQQNPSLGVGSYDETMEQGRTIMLRHDKTFRTAGSLELHVELPSEYLPSAGNPQAFEYSLEWMTPEHVDLAAAQRASSIIDLEALQQETTFEVDDQGQLLVSAREVVLKISSRVA